MYRFMLKAGLLFIGVAGVFIGSSFIVLGVNATGQSFRSIFALFIETEALTGLGNANAESELRFYSVFWIAYGVLLIRAARNVSVYAAQIPWLIGLFFAGGAARMIGYFTAGPPHPLFVLLMIIELGLPLILIFCWAMDRRGAVIS